MRVGGVLWVSALRRVRVEGVTGGGERAGESGAHLVGTRRHLCDARHLIAWRGGTQLDAQAELREESREPQVAQLLPKHLVRGRFRVRVRVRVRITVRVRAPS